MVSLGHLSTKLSRSTLYVPVSASGLWPQYMYKFEDAKPVLARFETIVGVWFSLGHNTASYALGQMLQSGLWIYRELDWFVGKIKKTSE